MGVCLNYVDGYAARMFLFCFFFGTACSAILFVVATGTTMSCSLCRQYKPVLRLYFLDVYDVLPLCLQWPLAKLFPAAWVGSMGQCLFYISYMFMMWHYYVCSGHWHRFFLQPGQAV